MKGNRFFHIAISIIILSALVLGLYATVTANRVKNLYNFAMSAKDLDIHVGKITISEKAKDVDKRLLSDALKTKLLDRKTVNFNIVQNLSDADLSIECDVTQFVYREKDPIDIFIPVGLVIDLATKKNYARIEYEIKVTDTKKNKVVWKKKLKATVTQFDMPKEKSLSLIADRAAYFFIKECFGKTKKSGRI